MTPTRCLASGVSAVLLAVALPGFVPGVAEGTGSVTSQGDAILRADRARSVFGVSGAGVRVGVISTGIAGLDSAKASGDLPAGACGTQINGVTAFDPGLCRAIGTAVDAAAEGTAMMEIIHDLAPGADLRFCAPATSLDMVACIAFLAGVADVIVDDLFFLQEPDFQDGPVADAAAGAVAGRIVYLSSAGNQGQGHYQGMFVDSGDGKGSHLIAPGNTTFEVTGSFVLLVLQWENPFGQATDDYDLCLAADTPARCAQYNVQQNGDDDPLEGFGLDCTVKCAIQVRLVSGEPRIFELFVFNGTLATSDQVPGDGIVGQDAVPGVLAIAAIGARERGNDAVEPFSSRGPSTIAFPAPEVRQKPDVAAIDGVSVTGAGGFPTPFFGTSAAAPHAAAIVALMLEANASLTPAAVQDIVHQTAVPLGPVVPNADSGWGRIDAVNAVLGALGIAPLAIAAGPLLPDAEVGLAYAASLGVTGGGPPVVVGLHKGAPPLGLALAPDGSLAGVPSRSGTARFTVAATDRFGFEDDKAFTLKVFTALSMSTTSLRGGRVGAAYSATLKRQGGKAPFTWSLAGSALPGGLAFDPVTGRLTGVPTESGTFMPTFQVTDALGAASIRSFPLVIAP